MKHLHDGLLFATMAPNDIFSMNQFQLEGATEKLSNLLECVEVLKWCNKQDSDRVESISQTSQVKTRLQHMISALEAWRRWVKILREGCSRPREPRAAGVRAR